MLENVFINGPSSIHENSSNIGPFNTIPDRISKTQYASFAVNLPQRGDADSLIHFEDMVAVSEADVVNNSDPLFLHTSSVLLEQLVLYVDYYADCWKDLNSSIMTERTTDSWVQRPQDDGSQTQSTVQMTLSTQHASHAFSLDDHRSKRQRVD